MYQFILHFALYLQLSGAAIAIEPVTIDYSKIAFYPDRWKAGNVSFEMLAWSGDNITLLTTPSNYDKSKLTKFVQTLDNGWDTYSDLAGKTPRLFRQIDGKPTICALRDL